MPRRTIRIAALVGTFALASGAAWYILRGPGRPAGDPGARPDTAAGAAAPTPTHTLPSAGPSLAPGSGTTPPILVIGLDGADWEMIRPLAEAGKLPNLRRLMERGASGVLRSEDPILSPILWTTIATGREPLDHGIFDFLEDDPVTGEPMRVSNRARRVPALWDLFSAAGLDVGVVGWWATWPAYPLNGWAITDRANSSSVPRPGEAEAPPGLFYPADLAAEFAAVQVAPKEIGFAELQRVARLSREAVAQADREPAWVDRVGTPRDPINNLRVILAATRTYERAALARLRTAQPALVMLYFEGIDGVCHLFAHCRAPALATCPPARAQQFGETVDRFYALQDEILGEILAAVRPETVVAVVSDHGFQTGAGRPEGTTPGTRRGRARLWHRLDGVLLLSGPPIQPGPLPPSRIRDVAPTLLYLAGLPLAETLDGKALLAAFGPEFRATHPGRAIADYPPWSPAEEAKRLPADREADRQEMAKLAALGYLADSDASGAGPGNLGRLRNLTTEAYLRERNRETAEARTLLRRALDLKPDYLPAQLALADLYRRSGELEEALRLYRQVLPGAWADDPRAYPAAAACFVAARLAAEGRDLFRPLAQQHPKVTLLQVGLATLERAGGDAAAAEATLRGALAADPTSIEAMASWFALLEARGGIAEAEPLLERALALNPRSAPHHQWLGRIAEGRRNLGAAAVHYAQASQAAPEQFGPLSDLGRVTALGGRLEEAAGIFRTATDDFPEEPRAPFNLAIVLEQSGDPAGALAAYREAERRGLRTADLFRRLGRVSAGAGKPGEAAGYYRKSLELEPAQPEVRKALAALEAAGG